MNTFAIDKDYNRDDFVTFLPDFLPDDFESTEEELYFDYTNIEKGFKLGSSDCINLDVFEFQTKSKRDSRVTLTKEVVSFMKKYSSNQNALVVFFSENSHNWRLSLITTDYEIINGKINRLYSNPRRFSFKLGEDGKTHTPTTQLFKKGQIRDRSENGKILTCFEDLQSRFAIEVVSDEFFKEYKVFYEDFVQYITGNRYLPKAKEKTTIHEPNKEIFPQFLKLANNDIEIACKYVRDYIKKLMGRLVFLHFLQKKGWLGVKVDAAWGTGDKSYLLNLFKQSTESEKDNFLEKVLEPLFFGMLNTSEDERTDLFNSKNWDSKLLSRFNRIPYLNGGLFEADELDEVIVSFPKELFSNEKACDAERKYQDKIKPYPYTNCCGLLDFFARYNFTIDETDPTDMEIGVEPEMLGKIFENLLEDNKDKGAFYTPKEIVQYMCRESLFAYLVEKVKADDNENEIRDFVLNHQVTPYIESNKESLLDALCKVKVCDPAVGSGAFPMGMLNELFYARLILKDKDTTVGRAHIKKEIVKNNIYGVDIEKGAVDIARLRFWLAIVVDEDKPSPLPNLDYKIMQGNSLLESYDGVSLYDEKRTEVVENAPSLFSEEQYKQNIQRRLEAYTSSYFNLSDHKMKTKMKEVINEITKELIVSRTQLKKEKNEAILRKELENLNLDNNTHFFLWHTWFSDVFNRTNDCNGFDIVIGNPPYIKEYENKNAFDGFRDISPYYMGKMDLWYGFACHGLDLLCNKGHLCFIAQNNWTTSAGAKLLRKKVLETVKIKQLLDFNTYMVFENASIQTMIMLFQNDALQNDYKFDYRSLVIDSSKENMLELLNKQKSVKTKYLEPTIRRTNLQDKLLTFSENDEIFEVIQNNKTYLDEKEIAQGIVPNPDVVNSRNIKLLKNPNISIGDGVFVVNKDKFLDVNETEKKYIKPLYEPYQMEPFYLNSSNDKCLLYITKSNWKNDAPTLQNHLRQYREIMEERRENINGRIDYMHLHWPREEEYFINSPKILAVRKCIERPIFVYYEPEAYVMMSVNVIKTKRWNMKFLTGILNSRLIAFWLKNKGKMQGENYQVDKEPLLSIPLPVPTSIDHDIEQEIIHLVETISEKKANKEETKSLETQLNVKVYEIYGLTNDEIKIVEN